MRRSRMTVRAMMAVVALAALAARITTTANHVLFDPGCRWIEHEWARIDASSDRRTTVCVPPFWPQVWRKALGLPWPGTFRCECAEKVEMFEVGGTECRPHRYVGSRVVSRDEVWGIEATLRSLKTLVAPSPQSSRRASSGP